MKARRGALLALLPFATACPAEKPVEKAPSEPSPNASILPATLASNAASAGAARKAPPPDAGRAAAATDSAGRMLSPDAGLVPPTPLREEQALPRDTLTVKDVNGVALLLRWVWFDVPAPPAGPEVSKDALKSLHEHAQLTMSAELSWAGRMRLVFDSPAFPLPEHSELRARVDGYGHVLVWPDGSYYRVLPAGVLRALLGERRADATPLVAAKASQEPGRTWLGQATTRFEFKTETGRLVLEQTKLAGSGPAAGLLCRTLVELVAVDPSTSGCEDELLPLHAEFHWPHGGHIDVDVTRITRRSDLTPSALAVPPPAAAFTADQLPPQPAGVLHASADLGALRSKVVKSDDTPLPGAPAEGLLAVNRGDVLRYVLLDGVPVAWVRPRGEQALIGLKPGRYLVSWRDFFGADVGPPRPVDLPARVAFGEDADGGAAR